MRESRGWRWFNWPDLPCILHKNQRGPRKVWFPLKKGGNLFLLILPFERKQNPLAGRKFYGGARGNLPYVRSPRFQRGEYGPAERKALSSALVGLTPSLNLLPLGPSKLTARARRSSVAGTGLRSPCSARPAARREYARQIFDLPSLVALRAPSKRCPQP